MCFTGGCPSRLSESVPPLGISHGMFTLLCALLVVVAVRVGCGGRGGRGSRNSGSSGSSGETTLTTSNHTDCLRVGGCVPFLTFVSHIRASITTI